MMFLLDTNAFSDLMRKHRQLETRLIALAPTDRVVICSIVRGDIRFGIGLGRKATCLNLVAHEEKTLIVKSTR